jgi:hypothetical protein
MSERDGVLERARVCLRGACASVLQRPGVLAARVGPRECERRARVLCSTQADSGARSVSS